MTEKIRLLLVDDEADFRAATSKALGRRGFEVTSVGGGEEALAEVQRARPEVVILDLRMEGMDGIETLSALRRLDEDLPVLVLTGHGTFEDAVVGIRLGIHDFLQKPVDVDRLSARLRQLLARGQAAQTRERTIRELMVPLGSYARVSVDARLGELVQTLKESLFCGMGGKVTEQGHRSVLVFGPEQHFAGVFRLNDLLALMIPAPLKGSPYATYLTGMFVAQTKLIGDQRVGDLLGPKITVDVDAPLMEAVNLMVSERLINLPVLDGHELVGVLRDKDLLLEIACAGS